MKNLQFQFIGIALVFVFRHSYSHGVFMDAVKVLLNQQFAI